ncbi:MAG: cyclophilin-like fold protein [Thermoproteota archaeon]
MTDVILVKSKSISVKRAILKTDLNPKTVESIMKALPFKGIANRWGDEIYFEIPIKLPEENSQVEVEKGDVAYWPPGRAMCIFFGPTPVSRKGKIMAYSPVNVFAKIEGSLEDLKKVKDGEEITVEMVNLEKVGFDRKMV